MYKEWILIHNIPSMPSPTASLSRSLAAIFRPPFDGLGLVCVLYFAWAFLIYPHSLVLRGEFPDTDDTMYLTQILDWLGGQGWYDNIQHRLDPPAGVPIHFSRLAQLPMAGIILIVEFLGLGPKGGATIMAMIYPLILLGMLFATLRWVAGNFVPKDWAGATAYVGIFATSTLYLFQPGHVDHHNLIVVLIAAALGTVCRMMQRPDRHRWPFYTGLLIALSMVIALEVLPWLLLLSAFLGLWAIVKGGNAARGGLLYGVTLFASSALGLLLTRPPADLMNLDVLTYSVVYVLMTGCIAVSFAGVFLLAQKPVAARFVIGLTLAITTGFWFLRQFPDLIAGPYGGIDPAIARIILDEINEAQPMKTPTTGWIAIFWVTASIALALPVGLWFFIKAKGLQRWHWGLLMLLFVGAAGLSMFYQRRFIGLTNMLAILPLTVLLYQGWLWIGAKTRGRRKVFAEIGLLLLVGPLPAVLLPALNDGRSLNIGVLLYPVNFGFESSACQMYELENALRDPMRLGRQQHVIMNPMGIGPELLFRTPHKVLSAPFHMDVMGNIDSTRFFSTPYPEEAEAIARRRNVDLVVACLYASNFYFHTDPTGKKNRTEGPGKDFAPHFIERLIRGHIPPWLKPVKVPGLNNYVVYEVLPPTTAPETK